MGTWEGNSSVGIGGAQITLCGYPTEVGKTAVSIDAPSAEHGDQVVCRHSSRTLI